MNSLDKSFSKRKGISGGSNRGPTDYESAMQRPIPEEHPVIKNDLSSIALSF